MFVVNVQAFDAFIGADFLGRFTRQISDRQCMMLNSNRFATDMSLPTGLRSVTDPFMLLSATDGAEPSTNRPGKEKISDYL
ncbi:hypothetical protein Syun_013939 [Stephania yunnanensis]|uniref:Uncharacterized protein n=1 Tax=Stephania yunnanensis TaxID=152371 RepID=A0AAP0JIK4_9MAGN